MKKETLPKVVREEEIDLIGHKLIFRHLDNGERVIDADSLIELFTQLGCERAE